MKKINKKGFMLTELLVTATLICTVLIFLYSQFSTVKRSYDNSFKYNTVNGLYALANMRDFLIINDMSILKENLLVNPYVDLLDENNSDFLEQTEEYYNILVEKLKIKNLLFTNENLSDLIDNINNLSDDKEDLKKFIRHIDYDKAGNNYRVIAEYDDGTFATLLIKEGD